MYILCVVYFSFNVVKSTVSVLYLPILTLRLEHAFAGCMNKQTCKHLEVFACLCLLYLYKNEHILFFSFMHRVSSSASICDQQ